MMFYYNQCQLEKMKINKGEFVVKNFTTSLPERFILQVMKPFEDEIQKNNLNFEIIWETEKRSNLITGDWRLYQLVIFNIMQNAVKYNRKNGLIKVQLNLINI